MSRLSGVTEVLMSKGVYSAAPQPMKFSQNSHSDIHDRIAEIEVGEDARKTMALSPSLLVEVV